MAWIKVTDDWYDDWRIVAAGPKAGYLWISLLSWTIRNDHDGLISYRAIQRVYGASWETPVAALEAAGLLNRDGDGWRLVKPPEMVPPANVSRRNIPSALRRAVYDRDGFRCVNCGADEDLTLDHIVPFSLDGPDTYDNLRTFCRPCNSSRGAGRW